MAYCDLTDIQNMLDEEELISLTDDDDTGAVVADVVTAAIADADAAIDTYLIKKYTVPVAAPVPVMIRKLSVDVAIYNLFSRRGRVSEAVAQRFKDAITTCRDISAGRAGVPGAADAPASQSSGTVTITSGTRVFTRTTMEGF